MRPTLLCVIAVMLFGGLLPANCQVATGSYPFGSFDNKGFDSINLGNLNAHFSIPITTKKGRGGLDFINTLEYDSSIWTPVGTSGSQYWIPATLWGWTADIAVITGDLRFNTTTAPCFFPAPVHNARVDRGFAYIDPNGAPHPFRMSSSFIGGDVRQCATGGYAVGSGTFPANDDSGIKLVVNSYGNYQIQYPDGRIVTPTYNAAPNPNYLTDHNGNQITSTGTTFTDTTGTVVLTLSGAGNSSSPRVLTYPTYASGIAGTATATVYFTPYNIQTAFGCSGVSEYSGPADLVDHIVLADGQTYTFTYEPTPGHFGDVTGRMASIRLPGGGHINYAYSGGSPGGTEKIVCQDGGAASITRSMPDDPAGSTWLYARTPGGSGAATSHTDVTDGLSNASKYDFVNDPADLVKTPLVVSHSQYQGSASGTPLLTETTCYNGATTCVGQTITLPVTATDTITGLNGTTSVKETTQTYNSDGLLTGEIDYDFGSGTPGSRISGRTITYAPLTNGIVDHPATIVLSGNSSASQQTTTYTYDGTTPTSTSGLPQHISVSGSRGNLTSVSVALSTSTSLQTLQRAYDDAGQLKSETDVRGSSSTYTYDSATDTFLTSLTDPTTGLITHAASATYDVASGSILTFTDENGNTSSLVYDSMLRPVALSVPASGSRTFSYNLASTTPSVTTSILHAGSTFVNAVSHLDPYGRISESENTDTPSNDLVDYVYDANGSQKKISNPYRSGATPVYTQYAYDGLGRVLTVLATDGSPSSTTYWGNSTTTQDAASQEKEVFSDGIGRIYKALEQDSGGALTLETDYQYDQNQTSGVGAPETYQMIVTQQGGSLVSSDWRVRTFTYDTLGRQLISTTPEAGIITYTYPFSGSYCAGDLSLPCTRTDANTTETTYSYDALNRLLSKTYSGTTAPGTTIASNTAPVYYSYDDSSYNGLSISNGKGHRTGMSDASGATAWSYDGVGNVKHIRKTVNGNTGQADYTYNSDASVDTVTDFSGAVFTYSYDVGGHPTQIVDNTGNSYAASGVYDAAGDLTTLAHQLTTGGGDYSRSLQYNTRLQPSIISATLNGSPIQSLTYTYGSGGTNNGDILGITNGMDITHHRDQAFSYDNLNRVKTGHDGTHWGEIYTYDNWGNLYDTSPLSGYSSAHTFTVTADSHNQLSNQSYDAAGQVTSDEHGHTYSYDAEGRLLSAGGGSYVYDGDGNRVEKTASSTVTLYWPGTDSTLDESNGAASSWAKQVTFNGLKVWSESVGAGGLFMFQDHLGSTRVTGDAAGNLKDDVDYITFGYPFANYGPGSNNHYTFTGYESDESESDTDYAVNRNHDTEMGRFNRPDPYDGSYDLSNPQSLNRYAYVANNPLSWTDPEGLSIWDGCNGGAHPGENDVLSFFFGWIGCLHFSNIPVGDPGAGLFSLMSFDNEVPVGKTEAIVTAQYNFYPNLNLPRLSTTFNLASPQVVVFCRGIEHPIPYTGIPLGYLGAQHCDALVTVDGVSYSISAGPDPPDGKNQVLRQYITRTTTVPTGSVYYVKGAGSGGLAHCLVNTASSMANAKNPPKYNPFKGPNSNNSLNQVFSSCGVNLGLKVHGPFF